jgi:farnesyl-diphosphate farnesyltransferase
MLFYLILRGLDTVEDDMTIPIEKKDKMLREFHTYLDTPGWNFTESKEPYGTGITVDGPNEADRQLLVEFDVVIKEFGEINETYRVVIKDITKRMGNGMADYANNAAHNLYGVDTLADFDMYCYYVAGLVGEGLTRLFIASGKENPKLTEAHDLYPLTLMEGLISRAYSMGLFLQKTNIIRDYREDLDDKRRFWPKEVWSKYAKDLADFADPKNMDAVSLGSLAILISRH